MPRMIKNMLAKLRFYCDEEACELSREKLKEGNEQGLEYEVAMKHLQKCIHREHECPLGCGVMIKLGDVDEHNQVCPNLVINCQNCELPYKPNSGKKHDCIQELKCKYG